MSKNRLKTLIKRISYRIERGKKEVFIRKDFEDLSDYVQIGRVLRQLISVGKLIRIGYGLYAKATKSQISGEPIPRKGINALAKEALARLNIQTIPSTCEKNYNEERSTQVPTGRVIAVRSRVSRKIGYNGRRVVLERVARRQKTY